MKTDEASSPLNDQFKFRQVLLEKEFIFLQILGVLLFLRPLFGGETFFFRDLYLHFYPQKLRWIELVLSGELPLWDPFLHGGQPFLADINNLVLYPSNLLYLILPMPFVFNLDIVFHLLLGASGTYVLARSIGLQRLSALLAAAIFGFCGYRLSLANLMNHLFASTYFPFVLLCWNRYFQRKGNRWFVALVFCGAFQLLAGAPEMFLLTLVTALGWTFFYTYPGVSIKYRAMHWLLYLFFVAGLSAVQIVPLMEMVAQSSRLEGGNFYSFTGWSLHPKRVPEILFPGFFGRFHGLSLQDYWGGKIEDLGFPYILSIYFGFVTVVFSVYGWRRAEALPLRLRRFLFVFACSALILSFGRNLPFSLFLYQHADFLKIFRYPIKFLAAAMLPVSILAAAGAEAFYREKRGSSRGLLILLWSSSFLISVWTLVFAYSDSWAGFFQNNYFRYSAEISRAGLVSSFLHAAIFCATATFVIHYRNAEKSRYGYLLFVIVVAGDLLVAGSKVNHYVSRDFFTLEPSVVNAVRSIIGPGKYYRAPNPPNVIYRVPTAESVYVDRWNLETLQGYTASLYSIPTIYHEDYDDLAQKELVALEGHIRTLRGVQRLPFLTAAGVSVILSPEELKHRELRQVAVIHNQSNIPFFLYNNLQAAPAYFVTDWDASNSLSAVIERMKAETFDPRKTAVIHNSGRKPSECISDSAEVKRAVFESRFISFQVTTECDGYLVLPLPFYNGWRVSILGRPRSLVRANAAFSAVYVEKGIHEVTLQYLPFSFIGGLLCSAISLIGLAVFVWLRRSSP